MPNPPFDDKLYRDIIVKINSLRGESRAEFLVNLAFLSKNAGFSEAQMNAVKTCVKQYFMPIKNGSLKQDTFNRRIDYLAAFISKKYRIFGDRDASTEYDTYKLSSFFDMFDHMSDSEFRIMKETLGENQSAYGYPLNKFEEIRHKFPGIAEHANAPVKKYETVRDIMEAEVNKAMHEAMPVPVGKDKTEIDEQNHAAEEEEEIFPNKTRKNENAGHEHTAEKRHDPSADIKREKVIAGQNKAAKINEKAQSTERLRMKLVKASAGSDFWDFVSNTEKQNHIREACDNITAVRALEGTYFGKTGKEERARDYNSFKLSFGRGGSKQFQKMRTSVTTLESHIAKIENNKVLSDVRRGVLVQSLKDTIRDSASYINMKLPSGTTIEQINDPKTRQRILYAQKVRNEARKLLYRIDPPKKTKTFTDVHGIGEPSLKDEYGNSLSKEGGSYDSLSVPADFKTAVESSDMKDRVNFEPVGNGRFLMTPKFPEKGRTRDGQEFSIRKNFNYLAKGIAQSFFTDPENPRNSNVDLKNGCEFADQLERLITDIKHPMVRDAQNPEMLRNRLVQKLRIPNKDKADFLRFVEEASQTSLCAYTSQARSSAITALNMEKKMNSSDTDEAHRKYIEKNIPDYVDAIRHIREVALIDPENETKMYLPNECFEGAALIRDANVMTRRSVPETYQIGYGFRDRFMENARQKLSVLREKYNELAENDQLSGKRNPLTPGETAELINNMSIFKPNEFNLNLCRRFYSRPSLIPKEEREKMLKLLDSVGNPNAGGDSYNLLKTTFQNDFNMNLQYLFTNEENVLRDIAEEHGRNMNNGNNVRDFDIHYIAGAGTVNYKGSNCMITFETTAPPTTQLINGIGLHDAKIGIFRDSEQMEHLYFSKDIYHDRGLSELKRQYVDSDELPEPPQGSKVLPDSYKKVYREEKRARYAARSIDAWADALPNVPGSEHEDIDKWANNLPKVPGESHREDVGRERISYKELVEEENKKNRESSASPQRRQERLLDVSISSNRSENSRDSKSISSRRSRP